MKLRYGQPAGVSPGHRGGVLAALRLATPSKNQSWYYVLVNDYKKQEPQYRTFLNETVRNPAFLDKMYTYAYEYLPARAHVRLDSLQLYYVALGDDATSQGGRSLVFSLYDARQYQLVRPGILEAHELHHALMNHALTPAQNLVGPALPGDEGLLWLLRAALIEGLANLTDKQVQLSASSDSAEICAVGTSAPRPPSFSKSIPPSGCRRSTGRLRPKNSTADSPTVPTATCRASSWPIPSGKTAC